MFDLDPALLSSELRRRAWLHARDEARTAYELWAGADRPDRPAAYAVYCAAEEREEAAAKAFGVS